MWINPVEGTGSCTPGLRLGVWADRSDTTSATHGIAKRRKRSAAKGTQEVAHPRSTVDNGASVPRTPGRGKGDARHGCVGETPVGAFVPQLRVHITLMYSQAGSEPMARRTGCLNWARPDLWEPRGAIPEATWQIRIRIPPSDPREQIELRRPYPKKGSDPLFRIGT
jgi:hypothetical protein